MGRGKKKKLGVNELRKKFFMNLKLIKDNLKIRNRLHGGEIIYAVDQSMARTGLTKYFIRGGEYISYSFKNTKGNTYSRIWNLGKWIEERLYENGNSLMVVFEGYSFGSNNKRELLGEVGYVVKSQFFEISDEDNTFIPCIIIPPTSLKKFVTGRGNGVDKKEMHEIVTKKWGAKTQNHDESDSYALAVIARNIYEIAMAYKHPKDFDDFDDKKIKKMYDEFFSSNTKLDKSRIEIISNIITLDGENIDRLRIN